MITSALVKGTFGVPIPLGNVRGHGPQRQVTTSARPSHQLELRGLLHGQIGGLGPFGDLVDVLGGAAEQVRIARRIGLCGAISWRDHREWPDTHW